MSHIKDCKRVFLVLDEVQRGKGLENRIKIYYDLYSNIKFIICGSATLNVKIRSEETLAGRLYSFYILATEFCGILELKGILPDLETWRIQEKSVKQLLMDYIVKGGFPCTFPELAKTKRDDRIIMEAIKAAISSFFLSLTMLIKYILTTSYIYAFLELSCG